MAAVLVAGVSALVAAQSPAMRGFTATETRRQTDLETRYRALPEGARLREYMKTIADEPHHAGAPGSRRVAEYILSQFRSWGLDARLEEFEALMPVPTERVVEMVAPEPFRAALREPVLGDDRDSADAGQLPTYNAYSADGDVTADLVYVNYGTPEDYEELAKLRIDVKGRIVIARYGRSWRGIKPKVAAEHGAVGCLIYSDPRDDGYFQGDVYPVGPWRPEHGAQRGSVMDMPVHPGDPLTPGWGSQKGGRKLARSDARTLVGIPVLPISYGDAAPLLRRIAGPVAPESWRGALGFTYHVGPGPARVRLKLAFDWRNRPLYNVIARIPGGVFPDEWIIYGNHHDAWVNGADDPTSGNVALMETARGLATLVRDGWKPRRTIVIASWDGEEWGLLGSTEWAEQHAADLRDKAVVYINTDSSGRGWLGAGGSHSLESLVSEVARVVPGPRTGSRSVFDEARTRALDQARTEAQRKTVEGRADLPLDALGSGSDYTAFLDHLTVATLNLGFGGDSSGGIYHSIYDSFAWYTRFSDGEFTHGRALAQLAGTLILRFADATVLPFRFAGYADAIGRYVEEVVTLHGQQSGAPPVDFEPLRRAVATLGGSAGRYEQVIERLRDVGADLAATRPERLRALNRTLYLAERALGHEAGLPKREWFRHLVYAPGLYTGYGVKTLPAIREGIEQKAWDEVRTYVPIVTAAVERLAGEVDRAATLLGEVVR
jgi:N-acetylated-alpha-linked acidic dipeptidase